MTCTVLEITRDRSVNILCITESWHDTDSAFPSFNAIIHNSRLSWTNRPIYKVQCYHCASEFCSIVWVFLGFLAGKSVF